MKRRSRAEVIALFAVGAWGLASPCGALVSSGPTLEGGVNINTRVGAQTFYLAGYTGSRAVVANIEAGVVWSAHESLQHAQTVLTHPNAGTPAGGQLGQFDWHATKVGFALGGRPGGATPGEHQRGIAYGATLWSGAIADSFVPGTTAFNISNNAYFVNPYRRAMLTGANDNGAGPTADVVNSAWLTGTLTSGNDRFSVFLDALVKATRKVLVLPAGNTGGGISSPASGHNGIVVGATASHSEQFDQVAAFSSRGMVGFYNPVVGRVAGNRARVDILAPGDDLKLAMYGGPTGGTTGLPDPTGGANNHYADFEHGTEFASAVVAGGAGLIVDYAKDKFAQNAGARDARVVKAVLLNSADKLAGWNNAQGPSGAGVVTTQALDLTQGAGQMNLTRAFDQFRVGPGHTNGTGIGGAPGTGGQVHAIGWDYGLVTAGASINSYVFQESLKAGTILTVTLNWLANCAAGFGDADTSFSQDSFANLDLEIWMVNNGVFTTMVGASRSGFSNTEHLRLTLAADGLYGIKVKWNGFIYNRVGDAAQAEYGLAWYAAGIPGPGSMPVLMLGLSAAARRRRASATISA